MKENEPTAIGRRIRAYRERLGIKTATELAARIPNGKITPVVIQNLEAGRKGEPTVSELLDIAGGLRISPLLLMFDFERPFATVDLEVTSDLNEGTMLDTANWVSMIIPPGGSEEARVIENRAMGVLGISTFARDAIHWVQMRDMLGGENEETSTHLTKVRSDLAAHLSMLERMGIDLTGIEKSDVIRKALYG